MRVEKCTGVCACVGLSSMLNIGVGLTGCITCAVCCVLCDMPLGRAVDLVLDACFSGVVCDVDPAGGGGGTPTLLLQAGRGSTN